MSKFLRFCCCSPAVPGTLLRVAQFVLIAFAPKVAPVNKWTCCVTRISTVILQENRYYVKKSMQWKIDKKWPNERWYNKMVNPIKQRITINKSKWDALGLGDYFHEEPHQDIVKSTYSTDQSSRFNYVSLTRNINNIWYTHWLRINNMT